MSQTDAQTHNQPAESEGDPVAVDSDRPALLDGSPVGRRTLMKGIGATAAGAVALGSDHGMVDDAEAIAPIVLYGGAVLGAAAVGWAVREYEVIGSNPPADGLTATAFNHEIYKTARTRKSTNASMFVDNRNIIQSGLPNTLYVEGKTAAIEALNAEKTQAEVETAALNAMNKYAATIERNFLKSLEESIHELLSMFSTAGSHPDVTQNSKFSGAIAGAEEKHIGTHDPGTYDISLADGTAFTIDPIPLINISNGATYCRVPLKTNVPTSIQAGELSIVVHGSSNISYLAANDWEPIWSDLKSTISNVRSGLQTWVSNVYSDVQAGSISVSDLVTPRQRAQMMAEEGGTAQAIADLTALGIPVDVGNKYTITMENTGATLRGTLVITDSGQSIEAGTTYNPSADTFSGDAFFTYNVATGSGDWSAFNSGIDGGVLTFTKEPYENTTYEVETSKNETVAVTQGNFTPVDSNGNEVDPYNSSVAAWEANLSEQLENDIANVSNVDFFASSTEDNFQTINLQSSFTVEKIENADTGETVQTANFETTKAQTDTNYVSQEEWDALVEKNEELINQYEASQSTGGGGIDLGQFDMFGLPGEIVAAIAGVAVLVFGSKSN